MWVTGISYINICSKNPKTLKHANNCLQKQAERNKKHAPCQELEENLSVIKLFQKGKRKKKKKNTKKPPIINLETVS